MFSFVFLSTTYINIGRNIPYVYRYLYVGMYMCVCVCIHTYIYIYIYIYILTQIYLNLLPAKEKSKLSLLIFSLIVTSSVTFIKYVNQSSIKPFLIWTCRELKYLPETCKCWAPCCLQAPTSWLYFHIIIIVIISSSDSNSTVFYSLKFVLEKEKNDQRREMNHF